MLNIFKKKEKAIDVDFVVESYLRKVIEEYKATIDHLRNENLKLNEQINELRETQCKCNR